MRALGRAWRRAPTISKPRPSPSRMSTTAKAGGRPVAAATASAKLSAVATTKPRGSIARAKRWHNGASSFRIRFAADGAQRIPSGLVAFSDVEVLRGALRTDTGNGRVLIIERAGADRGIAGPYSKRQCR